MSVHIYVDCQNEITLMLKLILDKPPCLRLIVKLNQNDYKTKMAVLSS